jgi:hypothetical protein
VAAPWRAAYAGLMNDTPDSNGPEPPDKGFWRSLTASDWVELAIYVFFGLIALLAGIGWAAGRW